MSDKIILCNNCITVCDECYKILRSAREQRSHSEEMDDLKRAEVREKLCDPMLPGKSLRDALILSGLEDGGTITLRDKPIKPEIVEYVEAINSGWNSQPRLSDEKIQGAPRRSFAQIVGRSVAIGIVIGAGITSILILSAMTAGWL